MKIACVVGARPNFMKAAPILRSLEKNPATEIVLIHTGQHYDEQLSGVFFAELGIRIPDISLDVGSGSHAVQTAAVMTGVEKVLQQAADDGVPFDFLIVVGDVNSTMAATVAAAKLGVKVAHVEAGLRSGDRTMPEEINRLITDSVADLLLCSEPSGVENLLNEGHRRESVHLVGNVMIDTLFHQLECARQRDTLRRLCIDVAEYGVVTLHRPSNVDQPKTLAALVDVLIRISKRLPMVFPVHPRTKVRLTAFGLMPSLTASKGVLISDPLGYLDFLCLTSQAKVIVTDSGGLQEESTAMGIPCLTMRSNTERPVTVESGTSTLIGHSAEMLETKLNEVLNGTYKSGACPHLWDGHASDRIAKLLSAA
ncbi:MAG: UDP-N-acetylglucosamine 2-epimerase (non-hydrolyzing) [Planctomycetaceae bacterium]